MPLTLIQLISEQTVPNLLPILRLRPDRLVHLTTPKTSARANHLRAAAQAAGLKPDVEVIELSAMPGVSETHHAVRESLLQARDADGEAAVNFTGGTKLMSIGAYSAALREKAPSLYVDTQDSCFVDGATSPRMAELLENDWSFTPIRKQLRVDILAIATALPASQMAAIGCPFSRLPNTFTNIPTTKLPSTTPSAATVAFFPAASPRPVPTNG